MKKLILFLIAILMLAGCQKSESNVDPTEKYQSMIELIRKQEVFDESSKYFDVETEITKIDSGYRFYVVIDNPKMALYDVEAIAIENDVDYSKNMAASVGVFEEERYNLVPNQTNVSKGYVAGVIISGTTLKSETSIYVMVTWKNEDLSNTYSEFLTYNLKFIEDHYDEAALNG